MQKIDCIVRCEYIGLSTEISELPTTDICAGSTFFAVDTKTYYIFYDGTWYEM